MTLLPNEPEVVTALDTIVAMKEHDVARVSEGVFKQHILPILTSTNTDVDLTFWLNIAGTAYRPIDVVNAAGEPLFRVPALLRQYDPHVQLRHEDSVQERTAMAKLKSQVHPQLGETFYDQSLERLADVPPPRQDDIDAWKAILARYRVIESDHPTTTADASVEERQSDVQGFDEF